MARITMSTYEYNDRRYGRPWIARVDFSHDPKGVFEWGTWIGQPGEPGELIIDAEPGDVVAEGQRDYRKPRHSAPRWYVVDESGELASYSSKIEAIKASRNFKEGRVPA